MDTISPRMLGGLASEGQPVTVGPASQSLEGVREPAVRRLLRFVLRQKLFIGGGIAIGALLGILLTFLMTQQFTSVAQLQISREGSRVTTIDGVERDTSYWDQEFYQTQYGLLRSSSLAERVATDLKLVDDQSFFATFGEDEPFQPDARPLSHPVRRAKRTEIAGRILLELVGVAPVRGSSLVDITVTSPDPALSQKIAKAWAEAFVDMSFERRVDASSYARRFLQSRIDTLRKSLEDSERKAVDYAANQGIINLPQAGDGEGKGTLSAGSRSMLTDELGLINGALATATSERIEAQARLAAASRPDATIEAMNNAALGAMRGQQAEVASEYAKASARFGPEYPDVRSLAGQMREMDESIDDEVARIRGTLAHSYKATVLRESALKGMVRSLKGDLNDLRRRTIQYNIYLRDADTNRELYNSLLQRYKEIGVAGSVESNNIAIINEPKVPDKQSKPNLFLNLILAMLAGGLVGIAVATVLNQIDQTIKNPDEARDKLALPLLGSLPRLKTGEPLDALDDPRSALREAYHSVKASLDLATSHGMPQSLAITSSRPREGKSTSVIALSQLLARAGRKVVLVDGDMRSPSVHQSLDLPNEFGLSNLLSGSGDIGAALRETDHEGLFAITAGPQPPNTAELLSGDGLARLFNSLLEQFDHVVVDSPPVLGLADAQLVGSAVEAVVFVVEAGSIQAGIARAAIDRLRTARINLVGVLLAKFDPEKEPMGDGYGYGYGYGYGDARPSDSAG